MSRKLLMRCLLLICFAGGVAPLVQAGILLRDSAEQVELTYWDSIKDSNQAGDYAAYLQAYPKGRFAGLARSRLERLKAAAPAPEALPPEPVKPAKKSLPEHRPRAAVPSPQPQPPAQQPAQLPAQPAAAPAPPTTSPAVREVRDCPTCPLLVSLPAGSFRMGSNTGDLSERPAHPVTLAAPFAIGKFAVTEEQWKFCVDAGACTRSSIDGATKNQPVRDVSWDDVQQYLGWLSKSSGQSYRLPTEAEWEYAARGGTTTRYWWGEQLQGGHANCKDCGLPYRSEGPLDVGSFGPNPYGLHDMNGGVWQWVADCWHNGFKGAPADGRAWAEAGCRSRVIRGGSWREGGDYMTSSTRFNYDASVRQSQNGFRVARNVQ